MDKLMKSLVLIWVMMIAQLASLGLIFYYFIKPQDAGFDQSELAVTVVYFSYLVILAAVPGSFKIYGMMAAKVDRSLPEIELFAKYRSAMLVKYMVIEAAATFSLIAYYMSGSLNPLYMFLIPVVLLLMSKPSEFRFREDFVDRKDKRNTDKDSESSVILDEEHEADVDLNDHEKLNH